MYRSLLRIWRKLDLSKNLQIKVLRQVNDTHLIGVTGVIFDTDHKILLVKHTYRRVAWSLPGGYLKGGEHPKAGLAREIFEETNFTVRIEKIIQTQHDKDTARLDMCYIGAYKKGKFKKSSEVVDYGFFTTDKLPPLIDDQVKQINLAYDRYNTLHPQTFFRKVKNFISFHR